MHKAILAARSPVWEFSLNWLVKSSIAFQVFKAMFQPGIGMTEAQTGRVEIKEIGTRLLIILRSTFGFRCRSAGRNAAICVHRIGKTFIGG